MPGLCLSGTANSNLRESPSLSPDWGMRIGSDVTNPALTFAIAKRGTWHRKVALTTPQTFDRGSNADVFGHESCLCDPFGVRPRCGHHPARRGPGYRLSADRSELWWQPVQFGSSARYRQRAERL